MSKEAGFDEERADVFIRAYSKDFPDYLYTLEKEALSKDVPIIRKGTQEFLRFIMISRQPKRILEVGSAIGFSALLMKEYTLDDCKIDTIENYPPRIEEAKKNFERYDHKRKIELFEGDAASVLKKLNGPYDLIFLDGPKGQYESYLDDILRLMNDHALLVTDNIFKEGDILESRYVCERRDRTIHSRMRDFLLRLKSEESLENVILPIGDGMTLSVKKSNWK